jgi:hypothetical protein
MRCSSFSSLIVEALNYGFLKLEVHDVMPNCSVENARPARMLGRTLASSTRDTAAPEIVHHARYCQHRFYLGTGDTAIVGNLHPSLENKTYHSVHDIGLQVVGHFNLVELELSTASLIYALHTIVVQAPIIIEVRSFSPVRPRLLLSTKSAVHLPQLYW